ncbi:MAG: hypothetical protein U0S76_01180 [Pseudoxanthomonas sp.]|nr:hypothetical protein [Pseudoxanthomonas sp.]
MAQSIFRKLQYAFAVTIVLCGHAWGGIALRMVVDATTIPDPALHFLDIPLDLQPNAGDGPRMVWHAGSLYAVGVRPETGQALYRIDPETGNSTLALEVDAGPDHDRIKHLLPSTGPLYAVVHRGGQLEIWAVTGDQQATRVATLAGDTGTAVILGMATAGDRIVFGEGASLWSVRPGESKIQLQSSAGGWSYTRMATVGNRVVFLREAAQPPVLLELWSTEGLPGSNALLMSVPAGHAWEWPRVLHDAGDGYYWLLVRDCVHQRLVRTDGSAAGTQVADWTQEPSCVSQPLALSALGHQAYYTRSHFAGSNHVSELRRFDGSSSAVSVIESVVGGLSQPPLFLSLAAVDDGLLYARTDEGLLRYSSPIGHGLVLEGGAPVAFPAAPAQVGHRWLRNGGGILRSRPVPAGQGDGDEIVRLRAAVDGVSLVLRDVPFMLSTSARSSDQLFYFASRPGQHTHEIWRSDGTPAGTAPLADVWRGTRSSRAANIPAPGYRADGEWIADRFYGSSCSGACPFPWPFRVDLQNGQWHDLQLDGGLQFDSTPLAIGSRLVYRTSGAEPFALWHAAEDLLNPEILQAAGGMPLTGVDGGAVPYLLFRCRVPPQDQVGVCAWSAPWGTRVLVDAGAGQDLQVAPYGQHGGVAMLAIRRPIDGADLLWRTDGTVTGTQQLVPPLLPCPTFDPRGVTGTGGQLVFCAQDVQGSGLWGMPRAGGTPTRIRQFDQNPVDLSASGSGMVAFRLWQPPEGWTVWASDLTAAGTVRLPVPPLAPGNSPAWVGNHLHIATGPDYWISTGTPAGTQRAIDGLGEWYFGPPVSIPSSLLDPDESPHQALFACRRDGRQNLCRISGDGTWWQAGLLPSPGGARYAPVNYFRSENRLLFWLDDWIHGEEPWQVLPDRAFRNGFESSD